METLTVEELNMLRESLAQVSVLATIPIAPVAPATVAGSATFTSGILTAYTAPS